MTLKYRTIDTSTLKGLKTAERLARNGWKIIRTGFWTITFEKKVTTKKATK